MIYFSGGTNTKDITAFMKFWQYLTGKVDALDVIKENCTLPKRFLTNRKLNGALFHSTKLQQLLFKDENQAESLSLVLIIAVKRLRMPVGNTTPHSSFSGRLAGLHL